MSKSEDLDLWQPVAEDEAESISMLRFHGDCYLAELERKFKDNPPTSEPNPCDFERWEEWVDAVAYWAILARPLQQPGRETEASQALRNSWQRLFNIMGVDMWGRPAQPEAQPQDPTPAAGEDLEIELPDRLAALPIQRKGEA